jgi:Tol biopolymer transport system component
VTRLTRAQSKREREYETTFQGLAWSPDGSRLAAEKEDAFGSTVVIVNARGGERSLGPGSQPVWTSRGHIAMVAGRHVHAMRADGRGRRRINVLGQKFGLGWATRARRLLFASATRRGVQFYSANLVTGNVSPLRRNLGSVRGDRGWARDGSAFALNTSWRDGIVDSVNAIDLLAPAGKSRRLLRPAADSHPMLSSDGRQIVFVRRVEGRNYVIVMNSDGTKARRLTSGTAPQWSPAGQKIAFTRAGAVYTMSVDGSRQIRLGAGQSFSFSPDGNSVAVARADAIFVVGVDGLRERRVTGDLSSCAATPRDPRWAPDGERISFTMRDCDGEEVLIARADGSQLVPLAEGSDARWSPVGDRLVLVSSGIFVMRLDGTDRIQIAAFGQAPAWSHDGRRIAFIRPGERTGEIHVINADGTDEITVATDVAVQATTLGGVLPIHWRSP